MVSATVRPLLKLRACLVGAAALACGIIMMLGVSSAYAESIPQLASDVVPSNSAAVPVTIQVSLDQAAARDDALQLVREFRQEALDEGIVTLPDGMTRDEYLTNFGWDSDLERIAIQRSIEANLVISHTRPDSTSCFTARTDAAISGGEILAWPGASMATGFMIWKTEKADYVKKNNGESDYGETGHYEAIISPYNTAYGFAGVSVSGSSYGSCACGEFAGWVADGESTGYSGSYDAIVNVADSASLSSSIKLKSDKSVIAPNRTAQLSISVTLSPYSNIDARVETEKASYTSSNTDVATVDSNGVVTGVAEGDATITATVGDKTSDIQISVAYKQDMYRLYNPNSGEHFYTGNASERDDLSSIGWSDEGVGWVAPTDSETPVYRLYNPVAGEHHYTTDASEKDALVEAGWNYEDIGWYSSDESGVPLYRQYNPNQFACNHNYTTNVDENAYLISIGWRGEGISWYGM